MNRWKVILIAIAMSFGNRAHGNTPFDQDDLLRGFGELKKYVLISSDKRRVDDNFETHRFILDSEALGRLLLVHELDGSEIRRRFLYSAERVIISVPTNVDLNTVQQSLIESGIDCEHPFNHSRILYVKASATTPEELYRLQERVRKTVGEGSVVEFDPIAFRTGLIPGDYLFAQQWHHEAIQSSGAWMTTIGDPSIIVAVVDGGIFLGLEEFEGRLVEGVNLKYEAGVEDNPEPHDDVGHGTTVTGLLAANANNGASGAGVDWRCKIMPIRALKSGAAASSPIVAGIDYAVANGARVINVSWGTSESKSLRMAVKNAADNGAVVVGAVGNFGLEGPWLPAMANEAIAVGASTKDGTRAPWSNWGEGLDLIAPGEDLYTVKEKGFPVMINGTSGSAPLVAGAASLLLSVNPEWNWKDIRDLLAAGAIDQTGDPQDTQGWDEYYGWGRLNIFNSMLLAHIQPRAHYTNNDQIRLRWQVPENLDDRVSYYVERSADLVLWERIPELEIALIAVDGISFAEAFVEMKSGDLNSTFYKVAVDLKVDEQ